jgi:WD40 repeat protein
MLNKFYLVAIGDESGTIEVYNQSLSLIKSVSAHTSKINRIKQSPFNEDFVATCSDDGSVKIWNATTTTNNWNLIRTYNDHSNPVNGLEWIDQDTIASGSSNNEIRIWSRSTGTAIRTINTGSPVYCLKLLSNGVHLASGIGNNIKIYNINDGSVISTLSGHSNLINDLALVNNENLLASSSEDYNVFIWNLTTYTIKSTLTEHTNSVYGLKMISKEILASGSADTSIRIWNITNGNRIRILTNSLEIYWSVDMLNDAVTVVSGTKGGLVELRNVNDGSSLRSISTGLVIRTLATLNITTASTSKNNWFNFFLIV